MVASSPVRLLWTYSHRHTQRWASVIIQTLNPTQLAIKIDLQIYQAAQRKEILSPQHPTFPFPPQHHTHAKNGAFPVQSGGTILLSWATRGSHYLLLNPTIHHMTRRWLPLAFKLHPTSPECKDSLLTCSVPSVPHTGNGWHYPCCTGLWRSTGNNAHSTYWTKETIFILSPFYLVPPSLLLKDKGPFPMKTAR